ncbi:MAG: sugar transferase [Rickettsiales bacterium]
MIRKKPAQTVIKRGIDIIVAASLLVMLFPLLLLLALLVRMTIGDPVIFRQQRVGYHDKPFYILKFRTMTNEKDEHGNLLPDEERRHGVGKWIRSWSLDELPQLWNILIGEMSLVGPRPLIEEDLCYESCNKRIRHTVRPGVTGLAQINGRKEVPWEAKLAMDNEYVENWNLWQDITILFHTLPIVVRREGVEHQGADIQTFYPNPKVKLHHPPAFDSQLVRKTGS